MSSRPSADRSHPVAFMPGARGDDPVAQYWLRQVTLRLRREVCWLWRERRAAAPGRADPQAGSALPPFSDRAIAALDQARYDSDKQAFFADDVTARYLTAEIAAAPPPAGDGPRGSFGWVAGELRLQPVDRFVLALALLPVVDSTAGSVVASCLNDPGRLEPTPALAQRLWDEPRDVVRAFDTAHPLLRCGLIVLPAGGAEFWQATLTVPRLVACELLFPGGPLPAALEPVTPGDHVGVGAESVPAGGPLGEQPGDAMRVVPIVGPAGASLAEAAAAREAADGRAVVRPNKAVDRHQLAPLLTTAWLRGCSLYLPIDLLAASGAREAAIAPPPLPALPLTVYVGMHDGAALHALGADAFPPVQVPPLTHEARLACWARAVPGLTPAALAEIARRFRFERTAIERIGADLTALRRTPTMDDVLGAARAGVNLGGLAEAVRPRFRRDELVLPPQQARQIDEIAAAMWNLTRVHYEWGTARAWNEAGIAALFAGPPGTGKTMAAEVLAAELSLPMYRIDLSQVVNKYIGETEKNLRRLFDAADAADVILFFDEADALFGRRTEVRDAHDRYANLEVSYLLERMERFKGLAILATNRRKDLDEAFLRRLRFVVEFPLPDAPERRRIWRAVIPPGVDASGLDLDFLAERFPLAGGHIRSVVFHACLQAAGEAAPRTLDMPVIVRAIEREYAKLDRVQSRHQFGPYASLLSEEGTGA